MRSTPRLNEAWAVDERTVHVRFEDGVSAEIDLSDLIGRGPAFEPLRDPDYFRRLRCDREATTVVWPNEADIAPESLYARAVQSAGID